MKNLLNVFVLIILLGAMNGQKIQFKKGIVLIDGTECLTYDSNPTVVEFKTNDGSQTILLKFLTIVIDHTEETYTKVIFVEQEKSLTSKSFIFTKKLLVEKLLSNKVLDDCTVNSGEIENFFLKFDEKIE